MSDKVSVSRDKLNHLANAVAVKSEVPVLMTIDEMVDAVLNIAPPKTDPVLQSKEVAPNRSIQIITADAGFDGLSSVVISAFPEPSLQTKVVDPTYEEQIITADQNYDGLRSVTISPLPYDDGDNILYGTWE